VATLGRDARAGLVAALFAIELSTVATRRQVFSALPLAARIDALRSWESTSSHRLRWILRLVLTPLKFVHYDRPSMFRHVGCRYELEAVKDEPPRWKSQVTNGREIDEDLDLECEV